MLAINFHTIYIPILQLSFFFILYLLCTFYRVNTFEKEGDSRGWGLFLIAILTFSLLVISFGVTLSSFFSDVPILRKVVICIVITGIPIGASLLPFRDESFEKETRQFFNLSTYFFLITTFYVLVNYILLETISTYIYILASILFGLNVLLYKIRYWNKISLYKTLSSNFLNLFYANEATFKTTVTGKPVFQGNYKQFVKTNIKYPEYALKNRIGGTVRIEIVLDKDGSTIDVNLLEGIGYGCDEEAIRVINLTKGKWSIGLNKNGEPSIYKLELPFVFNSK